MAETEQKSLYKKIKERQAQFEKVRQPYENVWRDVIELILPELSLWGDKEASDQGKARNLQVYNAGPEEALENWADGTQGHLASPSLDWFKYAMANDAMNNNSLVRQWLQECEKGIYSILRDSNFYPLLSPTFRGAGAIGNACMFIDESPKADGIDCSTFHPREVFIAENARGKVNIWHRKFQMTAKNATEEFGKEKLSRRLRENLANNPFARHEFIHAVYEQDDPILDKEKKIPDRPWVSVYIEVNSDPNKEEPLRIAGYWSKPFAYWRLMKTSGSVYGWGLGCSALVDIYGLNVVSKSLLQAAHMSVEPPLLIHKNLRGKVRFKPGGQTFRERPDETVEQIYDARSFPAGVDREERIQAAIDRRFNVDFFLMLARAEKPMTATEIMEKIGERSILMGPKIGRLENDLLNPIHDRVFEIALSNGWLPPPPNILLDQAGGKIDVQYIGPLAQAQKQLFETRRSQRAFAMVGPIVQVYPDFLDNMDLDESGKRMLRDEGWPEKEIRTAEQVAAMRQAKQEALRVQQQMEMTERAASQVPNLSKAPEKGSPIEQMAGAEAQ